MSLLLASSNGYSISLDPATVNITAGSLDLTYSKAISLSPASVLVTTSPLTFSRTYALALTPATVTITPNALELTYNPYVPAQETVIRRRNRGGGIKHENLELEEEEEIIKFVKSLIEYEWVA